MKPTVAVVGCGYWGKNLVRNFHELGALKMVCDSSDAIAEMVRTTYPGCRMVRSYEEVLKDDSIQAVVIATPAETHAAMARQALNAGKDVFIEKPLSLEVSSGEELVKMAKAKKRVLMVGHLLWYHPAILKLKQLVEAGELGRLQYIYSNRLNLGKIRREENILWSFAPHDISVILGLLDEEPSEVTAQGGNYLSQQIADVTVSCLSFPSGVKAHIFVSWLHPFKEQKLVLVGDKQMAVFDDVSEKKLLLYPHSIEWKGQIPVANRAKAKEVTVEMTEPLRAECEHFLQCVETRSAPRTDGAEALRVLRTLQMCQRAMDPKAMPGSGPSASRARDYFVHESAWVEEGTQIGTGTSIWRVSHVRKGSRLGKNCKIGQNVVIGPNAVIGDGVKIQNNVSVYEGVTLEDGVFCGPSMVFTNVFNPRSEIPRMGELKGTLVRKGATLGANCTILCGITVGQYAFVAAGATVTKNVPDFALVKGVPARFAGWMCRCGVKLKVKANGAVCGECRAKYKKNKKGELVWS